MLKPSELTPYTTLDLAVIAHQQAGLPAGVFNVVFVRVYSLSLSLSRVLSIYLSNMLTRSLSHARALCFLRSQKSSTCNYRIRERASEQKSSSEQKSIALSHCSLARSRPLPLWA